uniref:Uncharacterized protein n=1 Tax=Trichuris muris TaxID=70415 RepID=A0A5S6Q5Q4_TRIMR
MSQRRVQERGPCTKGHLVRRGQVGAPQGSNFRILMEPWVYENRILFPRIRVRTSTGRRARFAGALVGRSNVIPRLSSRWVDTSFCSFSSLSVYLEQIGVETESFRPSFLFRRLCYVLTHDL